VTRVLLVCNQFPKFSESFIVRKFLGLLAKGWDVEVACNRSDPEQWAHFETLIPRDEFEGHVHVVRDFDGIVAALQPDLVHFEFGHLALGRLGAPALGRCRVVASLRGNDINALGLDDSDFYEELWTGIDALHVLSSRLLIRARQRGCPSSLPHITIPPAVDTSRFDGKGRRHLAVVGTARRPLRLLSVGRLHWMKGYATALHAVGLLEAGGVHCEYRIVGGHDYGEALIEVLFAIHDQRLEDVVSLLGALPQEAVVQHMRWADVFLHPALSEGFCNAALEAQAMALPVVCTETLAENVVDGRTGLVAALRDPQGLADRLGLLARDPALRHRLGGAGRRRARTAFRLEDQIERFATWYRDLLAADDEQWTTRALRIRLHRERMLMAELERERERLARDVERRESIRAAKALVARIVPRRDPILIVSRGDPALLELGREAWHFPQTADGEWLGHHPASSVEAIAQLEELRSLGACFLLFPRTALWWLEHYRGLRDHLESRYVRSGDARHGAIFDLRQRALERTLGRARARAHRVKGLA
jgi:colanic acid/amylovoran biosynthesis glycosyltransferase